MKCFDALSKDSSIFGNRFLEASAGTGKTFAIEHVFLRLLLESSDEDRMSIENILVVTFTKAATRELKFRIRANIEKAISFLKSGNRSLFSSFDYLDPFLKNKNAAMSKLQSALLLFDSAQIYTIHGFCYFMLTKYPFESDIILNLSEESAYKEIVKKEGLDFLRYFAGSGRYFPEQISTLLSSYQEISSFIEKIINFNGSFKKELFADEVLKEFNSNLERSVLTIEDLKESKKSSSDFRKKLLEDFEKLRAFYKKLSSITEDELLSQLSLLISIYEKGECSFALFNEILKTGFSIFDFFSSSNRKVKFKDEVEKSLNLNYPGFFANASSLLRPLINQALDEKKTFNNLAMDIHLKARKKLIEEDLFTYDDLLIKMNEALDRDIFRQNVHKNFKAAIVDEFQDTDPIQWDILKKIFFSEKKDLKAFYLVGDPKQSIYSFRHADLATYFSAGQFLGDDSKFYLNTNYRSSSELVSSINFMLSDKFLSNWINIPKMKLSYPYIPVSAGKNDENLKDKNPVEFFITYDSSSKNKKWPSKNLENDLFFPYILKEIIRLNKDQGIKFENIAILVKDRYQAESIKKFLLKKSIPAQSSSDKPIYETLAFEGMKEILAATINCKDLNLIKIALGGPYIRWSDKDIKDKSMDEALILFCNLNEILKSKGLSHFFRSFLYSSLSNESSIYEKLINKNDLSFYQNTLQLIELLIEQDREEKLTCDGILNFFDELKTLYGEDDPKLFSSSSFDLDSVQIMTIHMSKGLEFEVVFALGACNRMTHAENIEEINLEKFRQLYVALTRAKKKLYVPFIIDENEAGYAQCSFSPMELFFQFSSKDGSSISNELILSKINFLQSEGVIKTVFLKDKADEIPFLPENESLVQFDLLPKVDLAKEHGLIHSFSSLSSNNITGYLSSQESVSEIAFSSSNITPGSEVGVIIHKIFERIFSGKEKKFWKKDFILMIIKEELSCSIFSGKEDLFLEIISLALHTKLPDLNFAIKDIDLQNIYVETEFLFSYKDEKNLMKGFVDLVLFHEGKYYLIDWKTNWLGNEYKNYSKENLVLSMNDHEYFLQAAIYSESLKRYLKIIDPGPFENIFGGAIYIFLRGLNKGESNKTGIFHFMPDLSLLTLRE